jgi:hypothetical protein
VAEELVAALGDRVLGGEEERFVVRGPRHVAHSLDAFGRELPGAQVLHVQHILAVAGAVGRVGEQIAVVARHERAERHEREALRELVQVEQDLFRRVEAALPPAQDRVLLPLLGARVVEETTPTIGRARVGFLDVPHHLLVEPVLEPEVGAIIAAVYEFSASRWARTAGFDFSRSQK